MTAIDSSLKPQITNPTRYRPEIDGLRALAVVPVVLFHMGLGFKGGYVGVDIFFVISGYLITRLIHDEIKKGTFSFANFWERRVRRIFPAMFVVLLATFVAGWMILLPDDFVLFARSAMAQVGLVANIFFRRQSNYFGPASETMPLLHTWSLSVEEQFYVAFPIILFLVAKRSKALIPKTIFILLCVSFAFSVYSTHTHAARAFFHLQSRAWELAAGAMLVVIPAWKTDRKWVMEFFSWTGIAAIVFSIAMYDSQTQFPGVAALLPCFGAFVFMWANSLGMTSAGKLLSVKPAVFVGLISYSLYLWHWPLIVFAKYWNWNDWNWSKAQLAHKLLFLAAIVVIAAASWRWIETPFRRRTVFASRKKLFTFALGSCALILAAAGIVRLQEGVPSRFPSGVLQFAKMKEDRAFLNNVKITQALAGNFIEIGPVTNRPISLLVWGDSHAMAITPALASLCQEHYLRGVQATHSSTAPLIGFTQLRGLRDEAADFGNAVVTFVSKNQVSNVVMAAYWEGYTSNPQFKNSLLQTVTRLREAGARVWIMKQVPTQSDNVPRAAAKEVMAGRNPDLLGVPLSKHIEKQKETADLFEPAHAAGARVLDPADCLVNSNGLCLAVAEKKCLYVDFHHLSTYGAMRLKPLFQKIVTAQP